MSTPPTTARWAGEATASRSFTNEWSGSAEIQVDYSQLSDLYSYLLFGNTADFPNADPGGPQRFPNVGGAIPLWVSKAVAKIPVGNCPIDTPLGVHNPISSFPVKDSALCTVSVEYGTPPGESTGDTTTNQFAQERPDGTIWEYSRRSEDEIQTVPGWTLTWEDADEFADGKAPPVPPDVVGGYRISNIIHTYTIYGGRVAELVDKAETFKNKINDATYTLPILNRSVLTGQLKVESTDLTARRSARGVKEVVGTVVLAERRVDDPRPSPDEPVIPGWNHFRRPGSYVKGLVVAGEVVFSTTQISPWQKLLDGDDPIHPEVDFTNLFVLT